MIAARSPHAIVIGGSLAGLLAARVLSDHVERVTVIERAWYPERPTFDSGVPQARHNHTLLARGREVLEQLFPGLDDDLAALGAPLVSWGTGDLEVHFPDGWLPRFADGPTTRAVSRARLDWVVRHRLLADGRVRFVEGHRVTGLLASADGARVVGVRVRARAETAVEQTWSADLVVDASGRGSVAPDWLARLGYPAPAEEIVDSHLGYASRWYHWPTDRRPAWKILIVQSSPPANPRGGGILVLEDERAVVTLDGAGRDYPPRDEPGFLAFARGLASPAIYEAIRAAEPLSPIYGYRLTANRWRHYEAMPRWPERFVVIGDAVCALNPLYGQGMTVAALEALTLDACLRRADGAWTGLARRFQRRGAAARAVPWALATGEDARYPGTDGRRPSVSLRLTHWYADQLNRLLPTHPAIARQFAEVVHLRAPAYRLLRPSIVWPVLWRAARRSGVIDAVKGGAEVADQVGLADERQGERQGEATRGGAERCSWSREGDPVGQPNASRNSRTALGPLRANPRSKAARSWRR